MTEHLKLKSCCYVFSLRTGALILLYLNLWSAIIAFSISKIMPPFKIIDASGHHQITAGDIFDILNTVNNTLGVIFSVAGLYGVYKKNHEFLLPYLIYEALATIILFVISVIFIIIAFKTMIHYAFLLAGYLFFLFAIIAFYFWVVVYNHYLEIRNGRRKEPLVV